MNKSELIESIVAQVDGITKTKAGEVLDAILESIEQTIAKGDSVALIGFGTFSTSKRAARVGRNPQTGEELKIAAATVPKFSAGKGLKEAVNKKRKK